MCKSRRTILGLMSPIALSNTVVPGLEHYDVEDAYLGNNSPQKSIERLDNLAVRDSDCYAACERSAMTISQKGRSYLFGPLLRLLDAWCVTPDHVTLLGLFAGLAFCPLYFWWQPAALFALTLHVLLDGLDGPLARYKATASRSGSFTDTLADQIVVATTTVTLMLAGVLSSPAGGAYIFLYTVVVAFAMVRNSLAVPYSWLFRPRFLVYAWLMVELWLWPGRIEYVVWGCNALLAGQMISGFIRIRKRIGPPS